MDRLLNVKLIGFVVGFWFLRSQLASSRFLAHFLVILFLGAIGSKLSLLFEASFTGQRISINDVLASSGRTGLAILLAYLYSLYAIKYIDYKGAYLILMSGLLGVFMIGKWHCFIIKDSCHGFPTDLPWGVSYKGTIVHPTIIYDVLFGTFLFLLLKRLEKNGQINYKCLFFWGIFFLSGYGVVIEFFKQSIHVYKLFSLNQILYLILFSINLSIFRFSCLRQSI